MKNILLFLLAATAGASVLAAGPSVTFTTARPCNGLKNGSIQLNFSGGTPTGYNWSNGATNNPISGVGPGAYGVTIIYKDSTGATKSYETKAQLDSVTMDVAVNTEDVSSDPNSNTGIAVAVVQGGATSSYTYQWQDGEGRTQEGNSRRLMNLAPDKYTLTVTDGATCTATASFVINWTENNCVCDYPLDYCGYRVKYNPYTNCMEIERKNCCNQKETTPVYGTCTDTKLRSLWVGQPVMFEIMGLNPLRYTYSLSAAQVNTQLDWSQLMQFISGLSPASLPFLSFNSSGLTVADADDCNPLLPTKTDAAKACTDAGAETDIQKLDIDNRMKALLNNSTSATLSMINSLENDIGAINKKYGYVAPAGCPKLNEYMHDLGLLACTFDLIRQYNEAFHQVTVAASNLVQKLSAARQKEKRDCNEVNPFIELNNDRQAIRTSVDNLSHFSASISNKTGYFISAALPFNQPPAAAGGPPTAGNAYFAQVKKSLNTSDSLASKLMAALDTISMDDVPAYVRYVVPHIDRGTDYVEFTIGLSPKGSTAAQVSGGYVANKEVIDIPTRGGMHFDYGVGLVTTGRANPRYDLVADSVTTTGTQGQDSVTQRGMRLRRTTDKKLQQPNIGIAGQGFFTGRLGRYYYFGGTVGAAFTSDLNFSALVGASFLYGKKIKVAISSGLALSTVRIPSGVYSIGDTKGSESLEFVNYPSNSITYDYSMRPNWFFSVTVNFNSGSAQQGNAAAAPAAAPSTPVNITNTYNAGSGGK